MGICLYASVDVSRLPTVWCEIIGGWDCDKVIGDHVQYDKATVAASLISVMELCMETKKSSLTEATCGYR